MARTRPELGEFGSKFAQVKRGTDQMRTLSTGTSPMSTDLEDFDGCSTACSSLRPHRTAERWSLVTRPTPTSLCDQHVYRASWPPPTPGLSLLLLRNLRPCRLAVRLPCNHFLSRLGSSPLGSSPGPGRCCALLRGNDAQPRMSSFTETCFPQVGPPLGRPGSKSPTSGSVAPAARCWNGCPLDPLRQICLSLPLITDPEQMSAAILAQASGVLPPAREVKNAPSRLRLPRAAARCWRPPGRP